MIYREHTEKKEFISHRLMSLPLLWHISSIRYNKGRVDISLRFEKYLRRSIFGLQNHLQTIRTTGLLATGT